MQEIKLMVEQTNGTIGINFEEIKAALKAGLEEYKDMVFTEDSKADAKKTVADLRKLKKSVNDKRLEIKKAFMAPYNEFENQIRELDKLIDEPIDFISQQVEEFERRRVEERKQLISELYFGIMAEHTEASDYLPLQRIYDSKWENSTTTKKAITEAIKERVEHVEKDLATIRDMNSEYEDKGVVAYKTSLELADAIATMNRFQKQKEEILQREKEREARIKEEELRREQQAAEKATVKSEEPVKQGNVEVIPVVPMKQNVQPEKTSAVVTYQITADPFQITQLEMAMLDLDIKFKRV